MSFVKWFSISCAIRRLITNSGKLSTNKLKHRNFFLIIHAEYLNRKNEEDEEGSNMLINHKNNAFPVLFLKVVSEQNFIRPN